MNAGMKDMLNVMSKFLALGLSLDDVIRSATWNPAREIQQEELGHLSVGASADVAVLRLETGPLRLRRLVSARRLHGSTQPGLRADAAGRQGRLRPERARPKPDWDTLPPDYGSTATHAGKGGRFAFGVAVRRKKVMEEADPTQFSRAGTRAAVTAAAVAPAAATVRRSRRTNL